MQQIHDTTTFSNLGKVFFCDVNIKSEHYTGAKTIASERCSFDDTVRIAWQLGDVLLMTQYTSRGNSAMFF